MIWNQSKWNQSYWAPVTPTQTPSNMPIQNISAEFTAQQLTDLKTDIEALNPQFPVLVTLTDAERSTLQRVAAGREAFCETAINGAATFPTVVPSFTPKAEWDKDENLQALHDTLSAQFEGQGGGGGEEPPPAGGGTP